MSFQQIVNLMMPFLASAAFVTLNEMGDKTQLLAMAFAMRIRFWKVMAGVLIATLLNHGLAVAVGTLLASVPGWEGWVKFIAAVLFVVFGLWALKGDSLGEADTKKQGYGDIATVAIAFFIAEMGDKTQLATITLAASYPSVPWLVLAGTTTGMLIADSIGIVAGVLLHRRIPDRALKILASVAFIGFGLQGLWLSMRQLFRLGYAQCAAVVSAIGLLSLLFGVLISKDEKQSTQA